MSDAEDPEPVPPDGDLLRRAAKRWADDALADLVDGSHLSCPGGQPNCRCSIMSVSHLPPLEPSPDPSDENRIDLSPFPVDPKAADLAHNDKRIQDILLDAVSIGQSISPVVLEPGQYILSTDQVDAPEPLTADVLTRAVDALKLKPVQVTLRGPYDDPAQPDAAPDTPDLCVTCGASWACEHQEVAPFDRLRDLFELPGRARDQAEDSRLTYIPPDDKQEITRGQMEAEGILCPRCPHAGHGDEPCSICLCGDPDPGISAAQCADEVRRRDETPEPEVDIRIVPCGFARAKAAFTDYADAMDQVALAMRVSAGDFDQAIRTIHGVIEPFAQSWLDLLKSVLTELLGIRAGTPDPAWEAQGDDACPSVCLRPEVVFFRARAPPA